MHFRVSVTFGLILLYTCTSCCRASLVREQQHNQDLKTSSFVEDNNYYRFSHGFQWAKQTNPVLGDNMR